MAAEAVLNKIPNSRYFTCLEHESPGRQYGAQLTIQTLEYGVKYVQS